ncbi:MAG TPA: hypothetical protein VIH57_06515 [Bacteroidales bacterium]
MLLREVTLNQDKHISDMKLCIYSLFILLCFSCVSDKNDVYKAIPRGSHLTKELLEHSEQIVQNKKDLILILNISKDWDIYNPHLLFFDSTLTLYSACYFPSEKIDSIKDGKIYGFLNESRYERKNWYRNDLPVKYKLYLSNWNGGSEKRSNKIIEKMVFEFDKVRLYVRKSEDVYAGVGWEKTNADSAFSSFILSDTLEYPISELFFDKKNSTISTRNIGSGNRLVWDQMIVINESVWKDFYDQVWLQLSSICMGSARAN